MLNNLKTIFLVCFSLASLFTSVLGQDLGPKINAELTPTEWFYKGNEAYENGDYSLAAQYYLAIDSSSEYSAEMYQNLGNVNYKTNNIPGAIYYFEKALKHKPGNDDLIYNLELANKRTIDKNNNKSTYGLMSWLSSTIGKSPDYWAQITLALICIGALAIALTLLFQRIKFKILWRSVGLTCLGLGLVFLTFAFIQSSEMNTHDFGINFSPSTEVKNEPSESASTGFVLHEGSKLEILGASKKWYKIQFNDQVGWVSKYVIKLI
jgi:tetratricopeptide (TPR) repeat protein